MYTVYKVISPSDKVYIGITKNGLNVRKSQHLSKSTSSNLPFHNAIKKYGDQLEWTIIADEIPKYQAIQLEKEYIKNYKALNKSYNITDGGEGTAGYTFTDIDRQKISDGMDPQNMVNSEETKLKKSISKGGKPFKVTSTNGDYLGTWINMRECARHFDIPKSNIWRVLNGTRKTAYNMIFKYEDL